MTDGLHSLARPLRDVRDLDPLLDRIGDARIVCVGEASHGTHEYYQWRADLTRRLLAERGFSFVAVEGDWPDCFRVTCSVTRATAESPVDALCAYERWPTWMWANEEVARFVTWLRERNAGLAERRRAGFYGLDVYSLWESMRAVLAYLRRHHPEHADQALAAMRCFEPYGEDAERYALASRLVPPSCEGDVVELLTAVRRAVPPGNGRAVDAEFDAEQNALAAVDAERYYRAMVTGGPEAWNIRDVHMADTLDRLLTAHGPDARAVVWEHNTHIGDARFTDMAGAGMTNVGQLMRERHGADDVVLVGFAGYAGTVVAAPAWGSPGRRTAVPPARSGSLEELLWRGLDVPAALLEMPRDDQPSWLAAPLEHRAIGVVYQPRRERFVNYVPSVVGRRYDALLWFADTTALAPLRPLAPARTEELETWPWAV